MPSRPEGIRRAVFLNRPFDPSYEPLFVALISSLVAIARRPRCVLELPETGAGRLARIITIIRECPVSIHDLSRVGTPARFNMPFELGIAVMLARLRQNHQFVILESQRYRLQRTLSDANGIDPGIHNGASTGIISCVLSHLGKPSGNPSPPEVLGIWRELSGTLPVLKRAHHRTTIFSRAIFGEIVAIATYLAKDKGLIAA
jgi:hypothetical protein